MERMPPTSSMCKCSTEITTRSNCRSQCTPPPPINISSLRRSKFHNSSSYPWYLKRGGGGVVLLYYCCTQGEAGFHLQMKSLLDCASVHQGGVQLSWGLGRRKSCRGLQRAGSQMIWGEGAIPSHGLPPPRPFRPAPPPPPPPKEG